MNQAKTKIGVIVMLAIMVLLVSVFVLAKPNNTPATTNGGATVIVPSHAVKVAEGVFDLGTARDVDGSLVQSYAFIDNRKGFGHKQGHTPGGGKDKGGNGGSKCFSLFAKGARWKTTEPYVTGAGVDLALTETSLNTWDSEVAFNIFGTGTSGFTDGADDTAPDGKNEVEFENLGATNTIAYTIVWGIFGGPPFARKLVEWDAVFNTDYAWSETGGAGKMDYQNIATHEFGHALGLTHPEDTCTEETMYAFADFGETKKRSLEAGDVTGVNELY